MGETCLMPDSAGDQFLLPALVAFFNVCTGCDFEVVINENWVLVK